MRFTNPRAALSISLIVGVLVFLQTFLTISASAQSQEGTSAPVGGKTTLSTITVFVRAPSGEPLTTYAMVRLYSADGTPMGQVSGNNGAQITFSNIHVGGYIIEVEAPGYAKAREDVTLAIPGEAQVQVFLRPESKDEPVVLSGSGAPVLAPKAKRELDQGREALRTRDFAEAEKHLQEAYRLAPTQPEVLYLFGKFYAETKNYSRAEALLSDALQRSPEHSGVLVTLGIVLATERKCNAAIAPLQKALNLNAQSWEARWALARCYYRQRNFASSLDESRKALEDSKGKAPEISMIVAASLTATGHYEEAAVLLRKFREEHPESPEAARAGRWIEHLQRTGRIS